ncbi:MAG TPA: DEAD/DEAH box helicase, partial [Desulfobacteraceae bacterium]|nr:DEAD/DEAH box helicase [Desulfobacteraceae bacterium]
TTVLSHWSAKIREHAPGLSATVYHGLERNLSRALEDTHILLTSYGILMRDIEKLKAIPFFMAVFDEIQHIKNPETLTHRAARELDARIKLGLTGTPIENHLGELKALIDLTVPGYLGKDSDFEARYTVPIQTHADREKEEELRKLISPFTLRRLKKSVLAELPEKIEDIRTCRLSDDQVRLYREVIVSKAKPILGTIQNSAERIPYMHVFAILNLLKQICNHPAMLENSTNDFDKYQSGKWELFKELLSEGLESGQKIVVYSQFLKTLELMQSHLKDQQIGHTILTGSSRNRGKIIEQFNNDPDCRVFLGSLKAGGMGIDLVGGSVVIHYDRWWNAAREDQATDRVHRIGQVRGVQVFKLVTEGTLEEKISAIIEKKRNLMESIIKEDDANMLKLFSRDELIEMLSPPAQ